MGAALQPCRAGCDDLKNEGMLRCSDRCNVLQVGSGPVAICAHPHAVSLAASHFEGPGLSRCVAGERAEFLIQVALAAHASAACSSWPSELMAVSDSGRQWRLMDNAAMQAKDAQGHLVTKSDTPFAVRVCCGDEELAGMQQWVCAASVQESLHMT